MTPAHHQDGSIAGPSSTNANESQPQQQELPLLEAELVLQEEKEEEGRPETAHQPSNWSLRRDAPHDNDNDNDMEAPQQQQRRRQEPYYLVATPMKPQQQQRRFVYVGLLFCLGGLLVGATIFVAVYFLVLKSPNNNNNTSGAVVTTTPTPTVSPATATTPSPSVHDAAAAAEEGGDTKDGGGGDLFARPSLGPSVSPSLTLQPTMTVWNLIGEIKGNGLIDRQTPTTTTTTTPLAQNSWGAGEEWGYTVSLSNDGTRLAVGSIRANNNAGEVRVYEYRPQSLSWWTLLGEPIRPDDSAGWLNVSRSLDGMTTLMVTHLFFLFTVLG